MFQEEVDKIVVFGLKAKERFGCRTSEQDAGLIRSDTFRDTR